MHVFNTRHLRLIAIISTTDTSPLGLAVTPDPLAVAATAGGQRVYVTHRTANGGAVSIINTTSDRVVQNRRAGHPKPARHRRRCPASERLTTRHG